MYITRLRLHVSCWVLVMMTSLAAHAVGAEDAPASAEKLAVRKSNTTLSNASAAAAAAANAASAAADAATSAARAASAAVEAINAVLPPSQRASFNSKPSLSTVPSTSDANGANVLVTPYPNSSLPEQAASASDDFFAKNSSSSAGSSFSLPQERSLFGLTGVYEIPVLTDARGDFANGLAKMEHNLDPVVQVNALDISESLSMAMGFSRDVLVAQFRKEQAEAQTGQARGFLLPSLTVQIKSGRETSSPGVQIDPATGQQEATNRHDRADRTLTLRQPLLDMPSFYDWRRRKIIEQARMESKRSSEGDTYIATINAYLGLSSTKMMADMAADYETKIQELYTYVEKRAKAGAANNSDKDRVKARALSANSAKLEQEAAHAAAGVEFVRVVNASPTVLKIPTLEEVGSGLVPVSLDQAMEQALAVNPEIAALSAEVSAANLDKTAALTRYLPKLDLEYTESDVANAGGNTFTQRDRRLMLVMNLSVFNGGTDYKFNEEKAARQNELVYKLDDQRRRVLQTLSAQYATLEATKRRINQGYSELDSITAAAKSMSKRMLSGNQSLLDMLDVYERNYQARVRLVNLHVQELSAVAQIARMVQGTPADALKAPPTSHVVSRASTESSEPLGENHVD